MSRFVAASRLAWDTAGVAAAGIAGAAWAFVRYVVRQERVSTDRARNDLALERSENDRLDVQIAVLRANVADLDLRLAETTRRLDGERVRCDGLERRVAEQDARIAELEAAQA